jgi:DNA-binding transcriptional LysR family regulator
MELRQLQYLAAVARHRSFTRAADELYVTQPALSQQVRRLEEELGVALLLRLPSGVELTPAGTELVAGADTILAGVADLRAAMDEHAGGQRGVARVATTPGAAPGLPGALAAFHALHPGIRVSLRQAPAGDVVALLHNGSADLAVAALGAEAGRAAAGLDVVTLADEPLRIVTPPGHPLAAAGDRPAADLRGAALVLTERGTALRDAVLGACRDAGFSPVPLLEVSDPATLRGLVHAGLGVSVVPASWLQAPGEAVDDVALAEPAPRHRVELLARASGASPAGRLLHEHLLARWRDDL